MNNADLAGGRKTTYFSICLPAWIRTGFSCILCILAAFNSGCVTSGSGLRRPGGAISGPSPRQGHFSRLVPRNYDYRKSYRLSPDRLMASIQKWMGTPYCMGGTTRKCTDCSGLVKNVFKDVCGAKLPRTSAKQFKLGSRVPTGQWEKGDLVFFRLGRSGIDHVGIYLGGERFAHASSSVGVMISSLKEEPFASRYAGARRLF